MKTITKLSLLAALGVSLVGISAIADDTVPPLPPPPAGETAPDSTTVTPPLPPLPPADTTPDPTPAVTPPLPPLPPADTTPPPPPTVTPPAPTTPPANTEDSDGGAKGVKGPKSNRQMSEGMGRFLHQPAANQPTLPDDLKGLIQKFQTDREGFLKAQEDLRKQLKGATADQRAALREQAQSDREKWLDEQSKLREDIRSRLKELKSQLASHSDAIDSAKENAKNHRGK